MLPNANCDSCDYYHLCQCDVMCTEFIPAVGCHVESGYIGEPEAGRAAFYAEWFEYIEAWSD